MTYAPCRLLASGLCLFILTPLCLAHEDDPKVKDRIPAYRGPSYQLPPQADVSSNARGESVTQSSTAGADMQGIFPASGITLRGWISLPEFAAQVESGNDNWGYVSPSGREYAIMGLSHGTAFVEVTDPGEPVLLDVFGGPVSLWRDMKVYEDHAYAVSEGGAGIQVFNLADIDNGNVEFVGSVTTGGVESSHNVAIDTVGGHLYRCGGDNNGLRIYALTSTAHAPSASTSNPVHVGTWSDRYVHDAEVVTYTSGPNAGKSIAYCCSGFNGGHVETGLTVLDVTDPSDIIQLDQAFYPSAAYSHQAWLSEDMQYLYLNDEIAGSNFNINSRTIIFDVSDPENVQFVSESLNGSSASTHNFYVRDDMLFAANYRSGLRVFDLSDPAAPAEIGYFDTWPQDDGKNYNGLWNAYPLFPSGTIIGSDMEKGLFIWSLGDPDVEYDYPQGFPPTLSAVGASIPVRISTTETAQIDVGSALLHYNQGNGWETTSLAHAGGDDYVAQFPLLDCGADVQFYVSVESPAGNTWRDPVAQPGGIYQLTVADGLDQVHHDACEFNFGWQVGSASDDATTGEWELADPVGTDAAPADDASPSGTNCWITGQGEPGGQIGENDVDDGATTLTSPPMNATGNGVAFVRYHRWYSNNQGASPNADSMPVYISNDNGTKWTLLETVTENANAWVQKSFRISDFVTPSGNMKLRFVASDEGDGSIVEAGVDEVEIVLVTCDEPEFCAADMVDSKTFEPPSDGQVDGADLAFMLGEWGDNPGTPADIVTSATFQPPPDGIVDGADLAYLLGEWGACE